MIETAVVIGKRGPLYWHLPPGRSGGSIPDSRRLWDVIWENRKEIVGIAHTHPGSGPTGPSTTDLTTFGAIERALGMKLRWWIASSDTLSVWFRDCDDPPLADSYAGSYVLDEPSWVEPLRKLSEGLTIEEVFGTPEQ